MTTLELLSGNYGAYEARLKSAAAARAHLELIDAENNYENGK
jgi:hypothetical protein